MIKMKKNLTILFAAGVLGACSTMPSGPSVLALPSADKKFDEFRNDDLQCRQFAHTQVASLQQQPDSKEEGQKDYDILYIQCMYSKGDRVPIPVPLPPGLTYDTGDELHPPPPPDLPAPPQAPAPESSVTPPR